MRGGGAESCATVAKLKPGAVISHKNAAHSLSPSALGQWRVYIGNTERRVSRNAKRLKTVEARELDGVRWNVYSQHT